ncbi:unnamed protein product [Effrenium voratum]|nr:unnamed protein product [Effrenium voratum]
MELALAMTSSLAALPAAALATMMLSRSRVTRDAQQIDEQSELNKAMDSLCERIQEWEMMQQEEDKRAAAANRERELRIKQELQEMPQADPFDSSDLELMEEEPNAGHAILVLLLLLSHAASHIPKEGKRERQGPEQQAVLCFQGHRTLCPRRWLSLPPLRLVDPLSFSERTCLQKAS